MYKVESYGVSVGIWDMHVGGGQHIEADWEELEVDALRGVLGGKQNVLEVWV